MEQMQGEFWSPKQSRTGGQVAVCYVSRCSYIPSVPWDEPAAATNQDSVKKGTDGSDFLPPINQKRVVIWYENNCVACKNSRPTFDALREAGKTAGFTVHEKEVNDDVLQRFPHVTVVPMYDVVEPDASSTSPYGRGTRLTSLKNDLVALRAAFPTMVVGPGDGGGVFLPPPPG